MPELSFGEVGEILQLVQAIEGSEVDLEWGDLRIQVRRGPTAADPTTAQAAMVAPATVSPAAPATVDQVAPKPLGDAAGQQATAAPAAGTVAEASGTPVHWAAVTAPMVGTCYRAPSPDEAPFVEVGDLVRVGDTVALIEVMKLFTELKTEVDGKVARIDVTDGELVEFGQALVWIEPS